MQRLDAETEGEKLRSVTDLMLGATLSKHYKLDGYCSLSRVQLETEVLALKGIGVSAIDPSFKLVEKVMTATGDAPVMMMPGMTDPFALMFKMMNDQSQVFAKMQQDMSFQREKELEQRKSEIEQKRLEKQEQRARE